MPPSQTQSIANALIRMVLPTGVSCQVSRRLDVNISDRSRGPRSLRDSPTLGIRRDTGNRWRKWISRYTAQMAVENVSNSSPEWTRCSDDLAQLIFGFDPHEESNHNDGYRMRSSTFGHDAFNSKIAEIAMANGLAPWSQERTWRVLMEVLKAVPGHSSNLAGESHENFLFAAKVLMNVAIAAPEEDVSLPGADDGSTLRKLRIDEGISAMASFADDVTLRRAYLTRLFGVRGAKSITYKYAKRRARRIADAVLTEMVMRISDRISNDASSEIIRPVANLAKPSLPYLRTVEYISLSAGKETAEVEIATSNRILSNSESAPYVIGTPTDEEWDDAFFVNSIAPVMEAATQLLSVLAGWSSDFLVGGIEQEGSRRGRLVTRSIDPPNEADERPWGSLSAVLHVRHWIEYRNIDSGYLDLWVMAGEDPYQIRYGYVENSLQVFEVFKRLDLEISNAIQAVARALLDSPAALLKGRSPTWETDSVAVHGGDGYRFRYILTKR